MPDSTLFQTTQLTRVQWWRILLRLAAARGGSARDAVRVFYHLALKPSLAFRGWARFDPSRILSLSVRGPGHPNFAVHARDNGSDVGTFEEFFSSRHTVIPPDLPALEAKVIYDIGANIGIASLYFASAFP